MSTCAREGCSNDVPLSTRRGRKPIYCSPACRPSAYRPRANRFTVEVDHPAIEDGSRPFGQVFFVRITSRSHSVVVASELSRPSADYLAKELSGLLTTDGRKKGGGVD
jgi:hypothetical protein